MEADPKIESQKQVVVEAVEGVEAKSVVTLTREQSTPLPPVISRYTNPRLDFASTASTGSTAP